MFPKCFIGGRVLTYSEHGKIGVCVFMHVGMHTITDIIIIITHVTIIIIIIILLFLTLRILTRP